MNDCKKENTMMLNKIITQLNNQQENISTIYNITQDINKKLDMIINISGLKSPTIVQCNKKNIKKNIVSNNTSKPVNNIMTYFKNRYLDDQSAWDELFENDDIKITADSFKEKLFEEHSKEFEGKNKLDIIKLQCNILYKSLSKDQKLKIKEVMTHNNNTEKNINLEISKDVNEN